MKLGKQILVILCIFIFMVTDPKMIQAYNISSQDELVDSGSSFDAFLVYSGAAIQVNYVLNGGSNHAFNYSVVEKKDLPVKLFVPERFGYNFAGWYTDPAYTNKIKEITEENAADKMTIYAKWTRAIDSQYNIEMYSYSSGLLVGNSEKKLSDCEYSFLDDVTIPGMPSTREDDYLNNIIQSESQCFQGICFSEDYILMTAYAEESSVAGSLLIFDRSNGNYLATLKMKKNSHLGGIAYDGSNVWICHSNNKSIERISYHVIREIAEKTPGCCVDISEKTTEYRVDNVPSCITYYGGRIWVATHTKFFNSKMYSYSYSDSLDELTALSEYNIPSKVQGVSFDDSGAVYLSTSYGRNNSSYLKVYTSILSMNRKPNEPEVRVEMPPCSEELVIADNSLFVLFESASEKYFEGTDGNGETCCPIDKVLEVTVASIYD